MLEATELQRKTVFIIFLSLLTERPIPPNIAACKEAPSPVSISTQCTSL